MKIFSAQLKGTTIVASGSSATITGSFTGSIAGIDINATNTFTSSTIARLNSIETITSSNVARLNAIETITSSNIARLNSIEIVSASNISRIGSLETISASNISRIGSIETITASNVSRLNSLEIKTGSLATTGSNFFSGSQTITGSLYISADLIVQGSSSLQNITASAVSIGTNIINLNTANPAIRYAGLVIGDSGSVGGSGSFLYDSVQDEMIFVHRGTSTVVTSSVTLMGPQTYDNLGNETYPTSNYIQKGTGNEHLVDSCIFDNGSTICFNTPTGSFSGRLGISTSTPLSILDVNLLSGGARRLFVNYDDSLVTIKSANDTSTAETLRVWGDNIIFNVTSVGSGVEAMRITNTCRVGIGTQTPCSRLNVHCTAAGGDTLYTNMFSITTDVSNVYNHLAFSPTSIEYRRETSTGVDFCIRTLVCNGSGGGNIIFAPNLVDTSVCSFPRMKIQQNGFVGIGAMCAQTYLHICDNLSAGRDDLIRLQTNISTNHVWLKSISCAGVTSIFGSNRANTDGTLIANHAVAGTTSGHNFDLISNSTVRIRISSSGAVCLLGNSSDYPSLFLAGPNYTMVSMGDRSSSSCTDVGFISVFNQGCKVIDLPGNLDAITFNTGGPMIAGRQYACGDPTYGYQFLEICNANMFHGPLTMGNSGGGLALTPLYCGGGKRWNIGWNSGELNNMSNYNNCTPFVLAWGINGDNPAVDRKFCFNYSGNAYSTGGTWGTLASNCIIKTDITAANSQWSDIKNICIVNYKMKEEIEEYGDSARIHLGVIVEQVAEVSPGLLEEGGYNCKWQTCLTGVKTSILHMKAVKALQEAMCRIEVLESCLGLS